MSKFDDLIFEGKFSRAERNLEVALNTKKLLNLDQLVNLRELLADCGEKIAFQEKLLDVVRQEILNNISTR